LNPTLPTRLLYTLLGIVYLAMGIGAILMPTGWLPPWFVGEFLSSEMQSPFVEHMLQEFGTVVVALGLVFFWLARQRQWSATFHWAMTFYFLLDTLIHWIGPDGIIGSWSRGTINTLPFVFMLLCGALQRRASK